VKNKFHESICAEGMSKNMSVSEVGSTPSNPVVCITLGSCENFYGMLETAINDYVKGIGFFHVPSGFADDLIKTQVKHCWQDFLKNKLARTDIIRVNIFIYADESAFELPALLETAEKYFSSLYPAGVLVDIYCLSDDANLLSADDCKKNVMQMLDEIQSDSIRVYLLSNLTSKNTFATWETAAQTAALLTLFKDCVPNLYVTEADASRYSEMLFLQNCASRSGKFLTAGSLILTVPRDSLKSLIMTEILNYGENFDENEKKNPASLKEPDFLPRRAVKSLDYLCGLAIPDVSRKDRLTRRQWISRLFAKRLDKIIEDYEPPKPLEYSDDSIFGANFYELLQYTEDGGRLDYAAMEAVEAAKADLRASEEKCKLWLEEMPIFTKGSPEAAMRRLSPIHVQDMFPYVLAQEYLRLQYEIQYMRDKTEIYQRRHLWLKMLHQTLCEYRREVFKTINENAENITHLNEALHPFTENRRENAADYFSKKFREYAEIHKSDLRELSDKMTTALRTGKFSGYISRVNSYIEKNVLPAPQFNQPIVEILSGLAGGGLAGSSITDDDITDGIAPALSEWVSRRQHLNIRLKTGYAGLYTEANLYMPAESAAADVKKHYDGRGLGRMNLFAEKAVNRVAVLYHAGAFGLEDLY